MARSRLAVPIAAAALAAAPLGAQPVATHRLAPPSARLDEEFTFVSSVRELSNGRVLITDEKENRIVLADFDTQRVNAIGRIGNGPSEYRQVGRLWPLAADSTLMADPFSRRWFVLDGGRIVSTRAAAIGASESGPILGADRFGRVTIAVHSLTPAGKLSGLRDSMFVLRAARGGRPDTIARIPSEHASYDPTKQQPAVLRLGGGTPRTYRVPFATTLDQVVTFNDGAIAIARTRPYRVDWCMPARTTCAIGPTIPEREVRIGDAEKRAYIRAAARTSGWPADVPLSAVTGWPEYFPPFSAKVSRIDASPLLASPDGRLLIERVPTTDAAVRHYDIVDRSGARVARLELPADQHIVGFGPRSVYIAVTDADDLQRLQRHPWP